MSENVLKLLDANGLAELRDMLAAMPQKELVHFAQSMLQVATESQRALRQRFPDAWEQLNAEVEAL